VEFHFGSILDTERVSHPEEIKRRETIRLSLLWLDLFSRNELFETDVEPQ
jgi:hypothetical protein